MLAAILALVATACAPTPRVPESPGTGRPIVLLTVDTLRADHLGAYGYDRDTSPHLDRLARRSLLFERAVAQWPSTSPSMASLFTSTYVHRNGMARQTRGFVLRDDLPPLAEVLEAAGYQTAAVVANGALGRDFDFDQGFDEYLEVWREFASLPAEESVRADRTTGLALGLLDRIDLESPYFLWVHYIDPHQSYDAPPPFADGFTARPDRDDADREVECAALARGTAGEPRASSRCSVGEIVNEYDAEIAYVDNQIGRLLDALEARGAREDALVLFTADHGEALGEDEGYFGHSRSVRQTEIHVPLLLSVPGSPRLGRRVSEPVDLVDIAPTLLGLVGLLPVASMAGDDLSDFVMGRDDHLPLYAFSEAGRSSRALLTGRFKLVHAPQEAERRFIGGAQVALFDLVADPYETVNVADRNPQLVAALGPILETWRATGTAPTIDEGPVRVRPDTLKQLEALGYLD